MKRTGPPASPNTSGEGKRGRAPSMHPRRGGLLGGAGRGGMPSTGGASPLRGAGRTPPPAGRFSLTPVHSSHAPCMACGIQVTCLLPPDARAGEIMMMRCPGCGHANNVMLGLRGGVDVAGPSVDTTPPSYVEATTAFPLRTENFNQHGNSSAPHSGSAGPVLRTVGGEVPAVISRFAPANHDNHVANEVMGDPQPAHLAPPAVLVAPSTPTRPLPFVHPQPIVVVPVPSAHTPHIPSAVYSLGHMGYGGAWGGYARKLNHQAVQCELASANPPTQHNRSAQAPSAGEGSEDVGSSDHSASSDRAAQD